MKKTTFRTTKTNFLVLVVLAMLSSINMYGAAVSWTGTAGDGLWSTDGNWSGSAVPGAADDVTIGNGFTVTVSSVVANINSLIVSGTLNITSLGNLPVLQTTSVTPIVNITGGNIQNAGTLAIQLPNILANANVPISFGNGTQMPVTNAAFNNTGTLSIDLRSSTGHSNASRVIYFNQTTALTKAQFNIGGTINLQNFTAMARFMELNAGAAEIDGTQTFGSVGTPVNIRFFHFGNAGSLTFLSSANVTIYSNFTNANGVLNMSNTGTASIVNNGSISIYGNTVTGSAINIQPQTSGTSTFSNYGTIYTEGNWAASTLFMNGNNLACTATFDNKLGATLTLKNTNSNSANGAAIRASATPTNSIINNGTINLEANAASRAMYFGDNGSEFKNYGIVTTNNAITGNDVTTASVFNNYADGVVNFNLSSDMSVAVSNNKNITFNNYGTITGKGILASGKFMSLTGTINPGIGTGTGIFRIYETPFTFTGKCIMQIKGKTTAGTDYDQIVFGFSPNGTVTIDPSASIEVTTGGSYTPTHLDNIPLLTTYVSRATTFTPANITKPTNWVMDYTTTNANLKYLAPTVSVASAINVSTLGDLTNTDLTVSSGNELSLDAVTSAKSITVAPGAKVTMTSNYTLSATNGITLQSDATGTATLVDNNTTDPQAVTATVQQYVTEGRNWYVSIPLESVASSVLNKGTSVVYYKESTGLWETPVANTLNKLQGYIEVAKSLPTVTGTTGTVEFNGALNTGAHSITTLTRTEGKTGFNLVGNPYPSYLDWDMVTRTNVLPTMWFRTKVGSVYKFYTYLTGSGAGEVGSVTVPAGVSNLIPPMQAFWVRVENVGTGSIAVNNNMRAHKDISGNIMKAPKQNPNRLLRLQVNNGTNNDETVLYFNENASNDFDSYDAPKMLNNSTVIPDIFTQVGTEKLVINGMNEIAYNTEIPLGFTTSTASDFTLTASELSNFEAGTRIFLKDKLNPTNEFELTEGTSYNFSSQVAAPSTDRFSLIFRAPSITTGVEKSRVTNTQVFVNAANQIKIIAPEKSNYAIYNAVGQLMENGAITSNSQTSNFKLTNGMYVVKVNNSVTKVIIK